MGSAGSLRGGLHDDVISLGPVPLPLAELNPFQYPTAKGVSMYDVEATVTETSPTVLKLTGDWPVDWLRETGTRTMEIQRELLHGEILELPCRMYRSRVQVESICQPRRFLTLKRESDWHP
jgi:hypothetical protein